MSLASQQDLRQRIQTQKSLPLPTVQFYAAEICLALDFLHSSGNHTFFIYDFLHWNGEASQRPSPAIIL